jgi:hypothetical protein
MCYVMELPPRYVSLYMHIISYVKFVQSPQSTSEYFLISSEQCLMWGPRTQDSKQKLMLSCHSAVEIVSVAQAVSD